MEDIKIFKVSPRVYYLGVERLQAGRTTVGFVSSNSWDINGAASAGLTTFWIQRTAGEPPEELGFPAHRVVRAITGPGAAREWIRVQSMPLNAGSRLGHYDVTALIGEGGMGQVYQPPTPSRTGRVTLMGDTPSPIA